jgi:aryl-alcohol dehydrogenase-like predicted oxidoreductase
MMEKRAFGQTEMEVTLLGYGAMELRHVEPDEAGRLLNAVLDAGITFVDTSPDYGPSEDLIGRYISDRRDEYLLATKCGCNVPREEGDERPHIWTREQLLHNIDHSLERLQTDHIDFWQIHSADPDEIQDGDLIEVMHEVQEQGKVRYIGYSASTAKMVNGTQPLHEIIQWEAFDGFQVPYAAVARVHEQSITEAGAQGRGVIIRGTVRTNMAERMGNDWEAIWERARLDELLEEGQDRVEFLMRYGFSHPACSTVIVGTSDMDHLHENVRIADEGPLPEDVYQEAQRRLSEAGMRPDEV